MRRPNWLFLLCLTTAIGACGEDSFNPARRVAAVVISRNQVPLEVGDSVVIRAEPRDVNGDPVFEALVTWSTVNASIANVNGGASGGLVVATGPGTGRIVAHAGFVTDTALIVVPAPFLATVLPQHLDTMTAVGDQLALDLVSTTATGPRSGVYTGTSGDYAVALPQVYAGQLHILAQGAGATWITVRERHGTTDSIRIVVAQQPYAILLNAVTISGYAGRTQQLAPAVVDRRGYPISGAPIAFTLADTAVATVSPSGLVAFRAAGTTDLAVTSPPGLVDSGIVTALPMPGLVLSADSVVTATGLLTAPQTVAFAVTGSALGPYIHLTVLDTSVATAPDSVGEVTTGGTFQVAGKQPGTTLLLASAPLLRPDTTRILVTSPGLHLSDADYGTDHDAPLALTGSAGVFVTLTDSLGGTHTGAGIVPITIAPVDTIVSLPQNATPYALAPPAESTPVFPVVTVDTGSTWVVASAPGFRPDSLPYRVTTLPALRFQEGALRMIGAGQSLRPISEHATITTTTGTNHAAVPVTFTRLHAAVDSFPDSVTIQAGAVGAPARFAGLVPGTDTIIAAASGYQADTLVLIVTTPRFVLPDSARVTVAARQVPIAFADSLGGIHASSNLIDVLATPADTSVAQPSGTAFPAGVEAPGSLSFAPADSGITAVTITDAGGRYTPKVMTLDVRLDDGLSVTYFDNYGYGPPAPGQRFVSQGFLITTPVVPNTAVHLASTDLRIVRVPDSVVLYPSTSGAVQAFTGDTSGTARIIATLAGFRPDTTPPVSVEQGHLALSAFGATVGAPYAASVTVQNAGNFAVPLDSAATFSLTALDNGVAGDTAVTLPAGEAAGDFALTFAAPGSYRLAVTDRRSVPEPYAGDTVTITAALPILFYLSSPISRVVGTNQRLEGSIARPWYVPGSTVIRVDRRGSHTASADSVMLGNGVAVADYPLVGLSVGSDTLVVSAPGYRPDTAVIAVTEGRVRVTPWPPTLAAGDSMLVYLELTDSAGRTHSSAGATQFSIFSDGGVTFSDGTKPITLLTFPDGSNFVQLVMRAGSTVGTARVRFYNLYYIDPTYMITVTP